MGAEDYIVLVCYLAGTLAVGLYFSRRNETASDMFSAGGASPWWVSGLSSFMTMFSAGTFVIWGGIAYKYGLVAVSINMTYGLAALAAGYFVAGRWNELGVKTPAEYVGLRFGPSALQLYTWTLIVFRLVTTAVALYALSVLVAATMPVSESNLFRDASTGNVSVTVLIILFGFVAVCYTMIGGLWAVLMTDVLQFIVLNLSVIFIIALTFLKIDDLGGGTGCRASRVLLVYIGWLHLILSGGMVCDPVLHDWRRMGICATISQRRQPQTRQEGQLSVRFSVSVQPDSLACPSPAFSPVSSGG